MIGPLAAAEVRVLDEYLSGEITRVVSEPEKVTRRSCFFRRTKKIREPRQPVQPALVPARKEIRELDGTKDHERESLMETTKTKSPDKAANKSSILTKLKKSLSGELLGKS